MKMTMSIKVLIGGMFFVVALFSKSALAIAYDWVRMGKEDIRVITNLRVEAEVRLNLINHANSKIDFVTFDQRSDQEVGIPILMALEKAAQRGVRIRFCASWLFASLNDRSWFSKSFLDNLQTKYPNLVSIYVGGPVMWEQGWGVADGIHEKLLLVDNQLAMVTGRGNGNQYFQWLDTAFVYKGPLIDQSRKAFSRLWSSIRKETDPTRGFVSSLMPSRETDVRTLPVVENDDPIIQSLDAEELTEIASHFEWLDRPVSTGTEYKVRALHHDFLHQMASIGPKTGYSRREDLLTDPIVEETIHLLDSSSEVKINILSPILVSKVKRAFTSALDNGVKLTLFTNGLAAQTGICPIWNGAGWYAGLESLDTLLGYPGSAAYSFVPDKNNGLLYNHRKLMLFERGSAMKELGENTVIFGSHNLTMASTVVQDELSFEFESDEFYAKMNRIFEDSLEKYGEILNPMEIHQQRKTSVFYQWIYSGLKILF